MLKNNELKMKEMNLKERVKFIFLCIASIAILTGAMIFFTHIAGVEIIGAFTGAETVYYDWRGVLVLLLFPVMGYFDVFVLFLLFSPLTLQFAKVWYKAVNIVWVYALFAFIFAFPLTFFISAFVLSAYDSCGGSFLATHYAKDPKFCEQFKYHPKEDHAPEPSMMTTPTDKQTK